MREMQFKMPGHQVNIFDRVFQCVSPSLNVFEFVSLSLNVYLNVFQSVSSSLNVFECVSVCFTEFKYI